MSDNATVAIVGLGYVGLPLAVAFGRRARTVGFDVNERKLAAYRQGHDPSGEVDAQAMEAARHLEYTSDPQALRDARYIIVVVPTPIDHARRPDLGPVEGATRTVGRNMSPGATVIFESTVYPGCTEEICVPILERESGLSWAGRTGAGDQCFSIGYSPERINPGDKAHRLETIVKVVSGDSAETLDRVAALYEAVIDAGVHRAPSIRVAEAAKVIENTQRDLNIALMNELAMIFDRLGIDTLDVLAAAGSKWNFLPFRPGLVGGHCIGVDPYYLTYKAESVGYHPQVVLGGRRVNDGMARYIAEQAVKAMARRGTAATGAGVLVLGLTFKENCPDLRNSKVIDVIDELREYGCRVQVHDPLADPAEAEAEFGVRLADPAQLEPADAIVLAVPHGAYLEQLPELLHRLLRPGGLAVDVKGVLDREWVREAGYELWRL